MRTSLILSCLLTTLVTHGLAAADNELTEAEKATGWQLLFNGENVQGWKCNNDQPIATQVEEGCLVPYKSGGYLIIYEKPFGDFVLKCDVRWEDPRCNSGIFFRVEDPHNPVNTGFEVQVMAGDGIGKHDFGCIYDLVANAKAAGHPTGEWNSVEITCRGPLLRVKVNGELVSEMNCDDFDQPGVCPDGQAQ